MRTAQQLSAFIRLFEMVYTTLAVILMVFGFVVLGVFWGVVGSLLR